MIKVQQLLQPSLRESDGSNGSNADFIRAKLFDITVEHLKKIKEIKKQMKSDTCKIQKLLSERNNAENRLKWEWYKRAVPNVLGNNYIDSKRWKIVSLELQNTNKIKIQSEIKYINNQIDRLKIECRNLREKIGLYECHHKSQDKESIQQMINILSKDTKGDELTEILEKFNTNDWEKLLQATGKEFWGLYKHIRNC